MIKVYCNILENGNLEITQDMLTDILSYMKRQDNKIEILNNNIKEAVRLLDSYFSYGINIQEPRDKIKRILKRGDKDVSSKEL